MPKVTTLSDDEPGAGSGGDRPRPTMRDVAALAGVSLKTVSRVINAEPAVSADLLTRVQRAIEQLDYQPNLAASNLRRSDGKTATVGLVLEDLANPWSAAVTRAVEDAARPRRVTVVAGSVDEDPQRERALVREFVARRVDGLIVAPTAADQSYLMADRRAGTALVFVDRRRTISTRMPSSRPTEPGQQMGYAISSPAAIGGSAFWATLPRSPRRPIATPGMWTPWNGRAWQSTGHWCGATCEAARPPARPSRSYSGCQSRPRRSSRRRTSLASAHSPASAALRRQFEVALVGFDDFPVADLLDPGVTVVAQDPAAIGRLAAEMLFRRLDGDRSPSTIEVVPTRLIIRGSGEIAPGG